MIPPLKVLLAEGGTSEASVSLRTFSASTGRYEQMYFVSASTSLLEALQKHRPDVALLQVLVLQPDPAATVSHLHECTPEVALIIWADPADRELAVKCIQAGAKDYVLEGFVDARTLHRIVRTAIRAKPGVTAQQATHEPKANFAKRPAYVADEHLVERPGLRGNAVRMRIEVQNFRMLREGNESLVAEELMQRISHALRKSVRASDSVASNSAGQFIVALQETEASSLPAVRQRIAARLLPFQQSGELRATLIFCIDDEANSSSVRARPREFPEAADLSEPSMLARP